MTKKLVIELSEEATEKYLAWAQSKVTGEVDECCEPSGCSITIDIEPSYYDSEAYGYSGEKLIIFGEVNVDLVDSE